MRYKIVQMNCEYAKMQNTWDFRILGITTGISDVHFCSDKALISLQRSVKIAFST